MSATAHVPVRLVSEANSREHWARKAKRAKEARTLVSASLRYLGEWRPELPVTVIICRVAPIALDTDNLARACKAIRDAVAEWLKLPPGRGGRPDDSDPRVTWLYGQRRGEVRQYGCEIRFEPRADHSPADPGVTP